MNEAIKVLKLRKAAGVDKVLAELIKHLSTKTRNRLLQIFKKVVKKKETQGNSLTNQKTVDRFYCYATRLKIFERWIMKIIFSMIKWKLLKQQAGFRGGKSCTGQILNVAQFIEEGYEKGKITGVAFVDLSAAYDSVNHQLLLKKIYDITKEYKLVEILKDRRFCITLQGKNSRWR